MAAKPIGYNPKDLTVLVVDDHDPMRQAVKRILHKIGFVHILESTDVKESEAILNTQPVDLVILDIYLRKGSGLEILENLRARSISNEIPVIVFTGEANKEDIVKASNLGANEYLLKPFQTDDFEKKVASSLTSYFAPNEIVGLHRAAERFIMSKHLTKALTIYETILSKEPASARATYGKASVLQAQGKGSEALELLQENAVTHPQFFKSFAGIANIYLSANKPLQAMAALRQELEVNPKQIKRQLIMAKLFTDQKDWASAMNHYRAAQKEDPKNKTAMMGVGRCHAMLDQLDRAVQVFSRVRRYYPDDSRPLEAVLKHCLEKQDAKRVEFFLKDERRQHPEREDAFLVLFKLYYLTERKDEGRVVLTELLTRNPNSVQGLKAMGQLEFEEEHFEEAVKVLTKLDQFEPTIETLLPLAQSLVFLKRYAEGILILIRACALNKANPLVFKCLADAHQATNQLGKAYLFYRKALQVGLNVTDAAAKLQYFKSQLKGRAATQMAKKAS